MRRVISILLILILVLLTLAKPSEAAAAPSITAKAAALFDLASGEVLAGINADTKVYPASTTKVLTALLVAEHGNLTDMVTISDRAEQQEGTALYCRAGEQYSVLDLLNALLVLSANDVAVALAEHIAGSVEEFAQMMNEKARELGTENSNFLNPNGLPHEDHYTTAADMAKIFTAAFKQPLLRDIMSTRVYYIDLPSGERRALVNGNKMLTEYAGTLGGKTGYTSQAGNCLVTAAQVGDLKLGVAVFKAQGQAVWQDAGALLDYGFANWCNISCTRRAQAVTAMPARYASEKVLLLAGEDVQLVRAKGDGQLPLTWELTLDRPLRAPLTAGQAVGRVTYFLDGQVVGEIEAKVAHSVTRDWYTYWEVILLALFAGMVWYFVQSRSGRLAAGWPSFLKRR